MSEKTIKKTVSFVIPLFMIMGLFLTCDSPDNPFISDMGPKVVVEPPTINDVSPVSGSYLNGVVTFTGIAKAYIEAKKVEVYIFGNEENGQVEIPWTDKGIKLIGTVKQKTFSFDFDTFKYNSGNDGIIRLKFRVYDSKAVEESIQYIYIIKNNPSDIKMTTPDTIMITDPLNAPKVNYGGEIQGQIIDRRGLRPGYPQIKIWPENEFLNGEPDDNDPQWGWASLFLPGTGSDEAGYDSLQKEGPDAVANPAGPGTYADRYKIRVVNAAQFSYRLAEHEDIEVDPNNPDLRRIRYRVENGKHIPFKAGVIYNFRIRSRDIAPDPTKGSLPIPDPVPLPDPVPWIEGFFPPLGFGTESNGDSFHPRPEPVRVLIFSSDSRPTIEINNDDLEKEPFSLITGNPDDISPITDPNKDLSDIKNKPNYYISEPTSKKIALGKAGTPDFRLRLFITHPNGLKEARLMYRHESSNRYGDLSWTGHSNAGVDHIKGEAIGKLFTFEADGGLKEQNSSYSWYNKPIFTSSSEPYILTVRIWDQTSAADTYTEQSYVVYMDGTSPDVSIRSVRGAAGEPSAAPVYLDPLISGFMKNESPYTVNGNIQVVVDRTDDFGIMDYKDTMGEPPPNLDKYPMVKWIVEEDKANYLTATDTVLAKLKNFKEDPNPANLQFFNIIKDTPTSGWVRISDANGAGDEDKSHNFKFNTSAHDGKTLWLYVIAQDGVQNLGFIMQKIKVVNASDIPNYDVEHSSFKPFTSTLFTTNASGAPINGPGDLDVAVSASRAMSGNWSSVVPKRNILEGGDGIELNCFDDDGINLDAGGVVIELTDLNENPKTVTLGTAQIKAVLSAGNSKDWSGVLSQAVMAEALDLRDADGNLILSLPDGMYRIKITVKDDKSEKVAISPAVNPGDDPSSVSAEPVTYWFAVCTEVPEIVVTDPAENSLGNSSTVTVRGYARSRLKIQKVWISFNPNVVDNPFSLLPSTPESLKLYLDESCTTEIVGPGLAGENPAVTPDAKGFYTYYWQKPGVVFDPEVSPGTPLFPGLSVRRVIVDAYDRLGNPSNMTRRVQIDNIPPTVDLITFNYGRSPDPKDNKVYLYGKVSFTVSASDANGLREDPEKDANGDPIVNRYSGIKWWVLPIGAPPPTWGNSLDNYKGTAYTVYGTWQGGYNFPLSMSRDGGKYTATIDTRKLTDGQEYRLYILAMDNAGNQSEIKTGNCPVFTVDQSRDNPVVDKDSLNPPQNDITGRAGLTITGTVSDADLFASAKAGTAGSYLWIRFPSNNPESVAAIVWGDWIPIAGTFDSGDIAFTFNPDAPALSNSYAFTYLATDGTKYYQIRARDEPDAGADGNNHGKNPDSNAADNPPDFALASPYVYEYHDAVPWQIYPSPVTAYYFLIDVTPPEIFFNKYDPTNKPGHNYTDFRPTYSNWDAIKDDLKGTVTEAHLSTLILSYGEVSILIDNPPRKPTHVWDIAIQYKGTDKDENGVNQVLVSDPLPPAVDAAFLQAFRDAPQGPQSIIFEATDVAGLTHRVSWIFYKDTQGPDIIPTNISRAVKHVYAAPGPDIIPDTNSPAASLPTGANVFPASWLDWPSLPGSGASQKTWQTTTEANWPGLRSTYGVWNWPSDLAYITDTVDASGTVTLKFDKIITALTKENESAKSPSVVSGDSSSPPVIKGQFSDALSYVWQVDSSGNTMPTDFEYRFRNKSGKLQGNAENGYWIKKPISAVQDKKNLAEWEITLNAANGFLDTFQDGENWVDIRVQDSAGNWSFINGLVFLVDRADPKLGNYVPPIFPITVPTFVDGPAEFIIKTVTSDPGWTAKSLPEEQRVFSADGVTNGTGAVFTVSGRVSDYNLSNLKITIGQDGATTPYTVVASVDMDPLSTAASNTLLPGSTGTGVVAAPLDLLANDVPDTVKRLSMAGPYKPGTSTLLTSADTDTPEWEWTLKILEKDIYGLRNGVPASIVDSTRRYISVVATDKARHRPQAVVWNFYLDTKKPVIEYNMDKGKDGSSFEKAATLSGTVSDDTTIQDVKFTIARWNYASTPQRWEWYNSGTSSWMTTVPSRDTWPTAFPNTTRTKTMSWTIDKTTLTTTANTGKLPADLFDTEGKYRLELYVTDYSIGKGNPHYTLNINDTNFEDKGNYVDPCADYPSLNGAANNYPTGANSNASGRVFFFDTKDPVLAWRTLKTGTAPDEVIIFDADNQTYVRNRSGQVNFGFTTSDANTIQYWEAVVKDEAGNEIHRGGNLKDSSTGLVPVAKGTIDTTGVTALGLSFTSTAVQNLSINPYMTTNGVVTGSGTPAGGTSLDLDLTVNPSGLPKTYTITITVLDGAKRSASITRQFILDNSPPVFKDFRPASFELGTPATVVPTGYSYETNTGKLNVKGNTEDNSNQLKRIAYYVVPAGPLGTSSSAIKNPADVLESEWHYYDGKKDETGKTDKTSKAVIILGDQIAIEIGEGTFAWDLKIPQTSVFEKNKTSDLVQWTKTGGVPLKGGLSVSPGKYRDIIVNRTDFTVTVNSSVDVPALTFQDLMKADEADKTVYGDEDVGLITVYMLAEDAAGNIAYEAFKYWIWPEGNRPQVISINNPDSTKIKAERLLNGSIRISGMATDNENVKYVWFRVLPLTNGSVSGPPYTLKIPKWDDKWEEIKNQFQDPVDDNKSPFVSGTGKYDGYLGSRRVDDEITKSGTSNHTYTGGWYLANGGGARSVSWWAYINAYDELNPASDSEANEIRIEVRAQDVTWDDTIAPAGDWKVYQETPATGYRGLTSAMKEGVTWVDAWVVAGAPIFEQPPNVASGPSAKLDPDYPSVPVWASIDTASIRGRSSYKVTVKHNSGLSALRWSPTAWNTALNNGTGGFQADSMFEAYNLLDLKNGEYIYQTGGASQTDSNTIWHIGSAYVDANGGSPQTQATAFGALKSATPTNADPRMTVTVDYGTRRKTGTSQSFTAGRNYLILYWDPADISLVSGGAFTPDSSYYVPGSWTSGTTPGPSNGTLKNLKNTVFTTSTGTYSIGNAVVIESVQELIPGSNPAKNIEYFKWDVIVDVRADLLADALPGKPKSVRYPVYLSATEVSKQTPLTTRGDTLLPIDNQPPTGMYTLNRKPAGIAATMGGEAGDEGPVNGVARVVLWFQRGPTLISWHEKARTGITDPSLTPPALPAPAYTDATNPDWWKNANLTNSDGSNVIPVSANVTKPNIKNDPTAGSGGDWAIVIDRNSPSVGQPAWGHTLPMGFANGGMGKQWYVQINSYGITSGPVDLHYVVIDKAGNAKYYKERLVIMNDAAIINKVNLATDIRDNSRLRTAGTGWATNASVGKGGGTYPATPGGAEANGRNTILQKIWDEVPRGTSNVEKGITADIDSIALGADKIIDFNVRNNLFALRVETTAGPDSTKTRSFRLEYVANASLIADTSLPNIKAGRVYIINEPGTAKWGTVGAAGDGPWSQGYAFLAVVDGKDEDNNSRFKDAAGNDLTGSVWELNSTYPAIREQGGTYSETGIPNNLRFGNDVKYAANPSNANTDAVSAEFVYYSGAFGTGGIVDTTSTTDAWPPAKGTNPVSGAGHSMFIIRVFDGDEADQFGDFTIIRVRVNNNDRTRPFAQLYDINPKTEGQDRQNVVPNELVRSISPMSIGANRVKGGLWNDNTATASAVTKPGHIEPRKITTYTIAPYNTQQHSLSSAQMGGAATDATITKPFANPAGFFATDTVSGRVVLRGYVEDNERVDHVALTIGNTTGTTTFNILEFQTHSATTTDPGYGTAGVNDSGSANYGPPRTGLLRAATNASANNKVYFTDSIDLYRHRVEWAYIWDTETIPSGTVVGNVNVSVVSYNTAGNANNNTAKAHSNTSTVTDVDYRPNNSPNNPGFPQGLNEYNSITMNIRPYITGFRRNQSAFAHNTRSRQGWYMFARNEQVVVAGFNLGGAGQTNITVGGVAANNIGDATGQAASHAVTGDDFTNTRRFRAFTVGSATTGVTGNGVVYLTVNNYAAVNTRPDSRPSGETANPDTMRPVSAGRPYIQPWNIEYSPGKDGSDLWDDFTQVHIWQSNDNTGTDGGRFASQNNGVILNPAMSIDPTNGNLYESHNQTGTGGDPIGTNYNTGNLKTSNYTQTGAQLSVMQTSDPIFFSDVYRSPGGPNNNPVAATWAVSSIIGKSGLGNYWNAYGGIYLYGPEGEPVHFTGGANSNTNDPANGNQRNGTLYYGESAWYNNSSDSNSPNKVENTDQFMNPHIVTSYSGGQEHIHVSYYDVKDGSIKYRYNRRGQPGLKNGATAPNTAIGNTTAGNNANTTNNAIPKMWVNLDGDYDYEDTVATSYASGEFGFSSAGTINANERVVLTGRTRINAGKHNSIAVTSDGYPVIAYYDETNSRLKLAVSKIVNPVRASNWVIRDYVIPRTDKSSFGTGQFVSMKIDSTNNKVHIAAMNTSKRLVYVTGILNPGNGTGNTQQDENSPSNVLTDVTVQVVDSVGNVGRWCSLSLDKDGNPWISYMDESYVGSRDGAKVAFLNKTTFYKGVNTGSVANPAGYFPGQYTDLYGASLAGWETMHVPTTYRVENPVESGREHGRLGMECYPTRILPNATAKFWSGAVGYLSMDLGMDRYRIAYYVK